MIPIARKMQTGLFYGLIAREDSNPFPRALHERRYNKATGTCVTQKDPEDPHTQDDLALALAANQAARGPFLAE